ncbi:hypothetical protein BDM02DRAFT_3188561 [Thelephora ganbajun]|uniref:Uncharacterized protein n=1 Tax=Thelephora ganbajun TaxID=370292 RepID=A0ACB6ZAV3_THEGA|nr:hypothetical protein BDM02DRAFT_3188561 [Thelephora ganbajun]
MEPIHHTENVSTLWDVRQSSPIILHTGPVSFAGRVRILYNLRQLFAIVFFLLIVFKPDSFGLLLESGRPPLRWQMAVN